MSYLVAALIFAFLSALVFCLIAFFINSAADDASDSHAHGGEDKGDLE